MKDIFLYTKKVALAFSETSSCIINIQNIIAEVEREYKIVESNPQISTFEDFQYITFKVIKKDDGGKRPMGFSVSSSGLYS